MTEEMDTEALSRLLAAAGLDVLQAEQNKQLNSFIALLVRWNARTNLTAVREPAAILERHFVECIAAARALPAGINTLLDLGSGAGFPGILIAVCRPEIAVTLAESQGKKAAFLQEAVRTLHLPAKVHAARAETLNTSFDCVTLRAVDRMEEAVAVAASLVRPHGWLAPLTTVPQLDGMQAAAGPGFTWHPPLPLPGADTRILALAQRAPAGGLSESE